MNKQHTHVVGIAVRTPRTNSTQSAPPLLLPWVLDWFARELLLLLSVLAVVSLSLRLCVCCLFMQLSLRSVCCLF